MISNEKTQQVLKNFLLSQYKVVAFGVEFDTEKCDETKLFFSYPEIVSEDCRLIDYSYFDDGTYKEMIERLIASPKDTCASAVKEFIVHTCILGAASNRDMDDFDIDMMLEDIETTRKCIPIKLYAKPRIGETWSKQIADAKIEESIKNVDKGIDKIRDKWSGYAEV